MGFIDYCKTLDWQKVVDFCHSLDDLNDAQYRFVKGRAVELLIEHLSGGVLKFVGERHKDFDCPRFGCTVELKSIASAKLYNKKGLQKKFAVKFNNSNGTNKDAINPQHVSDYLLVVLQNGVVVAEKSAVLDNLTHSGDGWNLVLTPDKVVEVSGKLDHSTTYTVRLKEGVDNLIKTAISNLENLKVKK